MGMKLNAVVAHEAAKRYAHANVPFFACDRGARPKRTCSDTLPLRKSGSW